MFCAAKEGSVVRYRQDKAWQDTLRVSLSIIAIKNMVLLCSL
jgi:hypothetical protein